MKTIIIILVIIIVGVVVYFAVKGNNKNKVCPPGTTKSPDAATTGDTDCYPFGTFGS